MPQHCATLVTLTTATSLPETVMLNCPQINIVTERFPTKTEHYSHNSQRVRFTTNLYSPSKMSEEKQV